VRCFPAVATNGGLSWVSVNVPQYRVPGDTALLQCNYDLGNGSLYSVKWYKDHEEFYRFVPKTRPQATAYRVQGATVDVSKKFFFLYSASKTVFPGCPRSAGTTISRTRCFLLCSRN
jgi:hypothetical protein